VEGVVREDAIYHRRKHLCSTLKYGNGRL